MYASELCLGLFGFMIRWKKNGVSFFLSYMCSIYVVDVRLIMVWYLNESSFVCDFICNVCFIMYSGV